MLHRLRSNGGEESQKKVFVTISESLGAAATMFQLEDELSPEGIRRWQGL